MEVSATSEATRSSVYTSLMSDVQLTRSWTVPVGRTLGIADGKSLHDAER